MNLTLLDIRNNPDLRIAMEAAARRHRARQIVLLAEKAFTYLFSRKRGLRQRHRPSGAAGRGARLT